MKQVSIIEDNNFIEGTRYFLDGSQGLRIKDNFIVEDPSTGELYAVNKAVTFHSNKKTFIKVDGIWYESDGLIISDVNYISFMRDKKLKELGI